MKKKSKQKVKVLYQNLNGVWYAFAESGEDVYFGKVPVTAARKTKARDTQKSAKAPRRAPAKDAT